MKSESKIKTLSEELKKYKSWHEQEYERLHYMQDQLDALNTLLAEERKARREAESRLKEMEKGIDKLKIKLFDLMLAE